MGVDYGGAAGGAMGGAGLGTMIMPGIGTAIGGVAGGLLGLFGKKKGTQSQMITYDPGAAYRDSANPLWNQSLAYNQDELSRLQQGLAPSWFSKSINPLRDYRREQLRRNYYGTPGQQGAWGQAMESGSITGLSPRRSLAQAGQARNMYMNDMSGVEDSITQMYMNAMQNSANTVPNQGRNYMQTAMSMQPSSQYIPGTPDSNPMASTLSGFSGGLSGLSGMFGSGQGVQGGVQPTNKEYLNFGGVTPGSTPAGYNGTIQRF